MEASSHTCANCHRTFSRAEHLKRHELNHQTRSFCCETCPKSFFRKDALQKHRLTHQARESSLVQKGARACASCASAKVRCNGGKPSCERCMGKGRLCTYPPQGDARCPKLTRPATYPEHVPSQSAGSASFDTTSGRRTASAPFGQDLVQTSYLYSTAGPSCGVQGWRAGLSSTVNWLPTQPTDGGGRIETFPCDSHKGAFPTESTYADPPWVLPTPAQGRTESATDCSSQVPGSWDKQTSSSCTQIPPSAQTSNPGTGEFCVGGDGARMPKVKRSKVVHRPSSARSNDQPKFSLKWLFSTASNDLRISQEMYQVIRSRHRALCLDTTFFSPFASGELPPKHAFEHLLQRYVENFHASVPLLCVSSWALPDVHWTLCLAISALGSHFLEGEHARMFVSSMHEFMRRVLLSMDEDPGYRPSDMLTVAQVNLLHTFGGIYSRDPCLQASARRALYNAVPWCRKKWARKSHLHTVNEVADVGTEVCGQQWQEWKRQEEEIRTGFSIWFIDSMQSFHYRDEPLLDFEIAAKKRLPCHERVWAAKDVDEWKVKLKEHAVPPVTMLEAVQSLCVEKRLFPGLGDFCHILLVHAILRRSWEGERYFRQTLSRLEPTAQKQLHSSLQSQLPAWPPAVPACEQWRNAACDCIDLLHWQANAATGVARGIEHPTVCHLHIARVILLAPMKAIHGLVSHLVSPGSDENRAFAPVLPQEVDETKGVIRRWAVHDQHKARLSAIHAGVLFTHIRRFSINGFYEAGVLATAALSLWALSLFSVRGNRTLGGQATVTTGSSAGDTGATTTTSTTPQTSRPRGERASLSDLLIHDTEPTPSSLPSPPPPSQPLGDELCDIILLDRPTDDELVQQFVNHGHLMRTNMTGVGDPFGPHGPQRVLSEARKTISMLGAWQDGESYWLETLQKLQRITEDSPRGEISRIGGQSM